MQETGAAAQAGQGGPNGEETLNGGNGHVTSNGPAAARPPTTQNGDHTKHKGADPPGWQPGAALQICMSIMTVSGGIGARGAYSL